MNKIKVFFKKNYIYFNIGMLFTGIIICFFSSQLFHETINEGIYITGVVCIAIWYLSFPYIDFVEKDKVIQKICVHIILSLVATFIMFLAAIYFTDNEYGLSKTIFCVLFLFLGSSYYIYFLRLFFVTSHRYIQKIIKFVESRIEPDIDSKAKKIIRIIEWITAILVSLTSFIIAITAFINTIKL